MNQIFDIKDRVIVVTGSTGGWRDRRRIIWRAWGRCVVYLGRSQAKLDASLAKCRKASTMRSVIGLVADVLDRPALEKACADVQGKRGRIDGLINGAGGNIPWATISPEKSFFDLDMDAFGQVMSLNLQGTVLPTLIFGPAMVKGGRGSIVNFSSASARRQLTRVVGYSAAKAGVVNFTRWLAGDLAKRTEGKVRVNAVLPGFFLGDQNRRLLTNEDGSLTDRGNTINRKTPFGRFGQAHELHGAIHYLLADASAFVTGTILPVDGGFGAFSGV